MPRDIPVGNGRLLIEFDQDYRIRDLYYPWAGKENHVTGHRFGFGVWADGQFQWVNREDWVLRLTYADQALSTAVTAVSEGLGLTLLCSDMVDYSESFYIRKVVVRNLREQAREVRLFFHHDFHIRETPAGDTAYFDPEERAIIHYKGDRYFLMSGMCGETYGPDQYATGVKEFHGLEGTWKDAEDGVLSGNAIAQGSVDSTLCLHVDVPGSGEQEVYYWIAAGKDYAEVSQLHRMIHGHGPEHFIGRTGNYWKAWVNKEDLDLTGLPPPVADLFRKSLLILRTNIDSGGAIIAANDSDIQHFARDSYSYMWPRDGALTAYALDMAGHLGLARRFFDLCLEIISRGKESVGYFLHKYNPDGSLGSSWHPWTSDNQRRLPIQEDGTGLVLWALWYHFDRFRDIEFAIRQYEKLVIRCGDFLASYRDPRTGLPLPSYDLWEEEWGIHTYTVSGVYAGLRAAENFARFFGDRKRVAIYGSAAEETRKGADTYLYSAEHKRFLKGLIPRQDQGFTEDLRIDASTYAPFYFGLLGPDDERVMNTMRAIEERLGVRTQVGGIARYEDDAYHRNAQTGKAVPGNPWFICTLWLAQWHIARAKEPAALNEAMAILEWVAGRALPSGVLAEQLDPFSGEPLSVAPLTWSHATFVSTVLEYLRKLEETDVCPACGGPLHSYGRKKR